MFSKTILALNQLREDLFFGRYKGDFLPSARQLCIRYNVGRGAIKVIVEALLQEGVLYRISERKIGIAPANIQTKKRKLLVISHPYLSYGWAGNIAFDRQQTVTAAATERGFEVEFATKDFTNLDYEEFQKLQQQQYSGVLFLELYHRKTVQELQKNHIPVLISGVEENGDLPCCRMDYRQIGRLAAYELIRHGHRRIGTVTGSLEKFIFQEILRGIRGAMAEEDLHFDPELVAQVTGQYGRVEDEVAVLKILDNPHPPTGIIALRRNRIMQLQSLCRQRNMNIPQDISIIGFDNPDWPGIEVNNLTMINDAALTLDKIAVNMLINQANSAQVPESFLLTPTLRHGGTTAPPHTI